MLEQLIELDNHIFLTLNGSDSVYWDALMWIISDKLTWVPMLLVLLYVLAKNCEGWGEWLLMVFALVLVVLVADRVSSGLIKPMVARWRPTHA